MDKRISSRAIIINDGCLLTMFRRKIKDGKIKEYYVIPGGGLEENESLEENVIRELKEEFSVNVEVLGFLGKEEYENTIEYYFHCKIVGGTLALGGPEKDRISEDNYYEIRNIKLENLDKIDINAKDKVKMAISHEYVELK